MKLSHKIFSMIVASFLLSPAVIADEIQSTNATLVNANNLSTFTTTETRKLSLPRVEGNSSKAYVASGGGGGAFPPDPSIATKNTFCVLGFCFNTNKK